MKLAQLEERKRLDELLAKLDSRSARDRENTADHIWDLAANDKMPKSLALVAIRSCLSDSNEFVRMVGVDALAEIGDSTDFYRVLRLLEDSSWFVRSSVVDVLPQLSLKRALRYLKTAAVKDSHWVVRRNATVEMDRYHPTEVQDFLIERLDKEKDEDVIMGISHTLTLFGYEPAIPIWIKFIADPFFVKCGIVKGLLLNDFKEGRPYLQTYRQEVADAVDELLQQENPEYIDEIFSALLAELEGLTISEKDAERNS